MAAEQEQRSITVLGATGSVGCSTLDLVAREPGRFRVEALTANRAAEALAEQARRHGARFAAVADETAYGDLKAALSGSGIEAAAGAAAIEEAAARPSDFVMAAIVGSAGLAPTLAAIRRGALVGLANKEALVTAGDIVIQEAAARGATLLPVDSEHNAIFQVLDRGGLDQVEKIILTASGGPFRELTREEMAGVTPQQAVKHPNWSMGAKISVDSATMMNKGLEVIEAHYLFAVPEERIGILVHPQSVVHSIVGYRDGSMLSQLGAPDMRVPIAHCLAWPKRMPAPVELLDLAKISNLTFEAPDEARFPALRLAREALREGQGAPAVLNAANEEAVAAFLSGEIGFLDIAEIVERTLEQVPKHAVDSLDAALALDAAGRERSRKLMADLSR
jgi:1-deoxy-D-xylulose-5-phosphate reductoisomerase